ncbi:Reverse transcriptase domain [Cinara cedri]|uniref:Reverse transcriptase domain n=1 Tax=Cinara cedri TaxID=506608 RepID=A0A5E4NH64_9HEMI|nr:Reverse transcriptase domain [Cinara cedri]
MGKMSEATIFSRLDAKKRFYQISLSEESSKLTTFNTPLGRYCFCELPFGLNVAPEIFYKHFSQLLEGLNGVQVYMDDIIVFDKNEEAHRTRLMNVMFRLAKNNVKLNIEKCEWTTSKFIFIGHEFSSDGIRPDPDKVKAIKKMAQPKCKKDIERFLGMYNYISKFIPHASDKTKPLRDFLKQSSSFQWSLNVENIWNKLKEDLSRVPVLQYYNPNKEIMLSVDAS